MREHQTLLLALQGGGGEDDLTHAGQSAPLAVLLSHAGSPRRRGVNGRVRSARSGVAGGPVTHGGYNTEVSWGSTS